MSLKGKAQEVLAIIEKGGFNSPSGSWVDIREAIAFATRHSKTYTPGQVAELSAGASEDGAVPCIAVTDESTQMAAKRLFDSGLRDVAVLNFASARNAGGGFLNGAKAQEEDLTRCSTLYDCLLSQPAYYTANRQQQSMLYTDHVIYSPQVPWFRTRSRDEPDGLFYASVITAPAPNANQAIRHGEPADAIEPALRRRAGLVLGVARDNGHRTLVLGAWGCGVFGNDPTMVASSFRHWLHETSFRSAFDRVVFAVYDKTDGQGVLGAFRNVLGANDQGFRTPHRHDALAVPGLAPDELTRLNHAPPPTSTTPAPAPPAPASAPPA